MHGERVRQDQAARARLANRPFGGQHHITTTRVAQRTHGDVGCHFGGRRRNRNLGGGEKHVVDIAAAQGASGGKLQTAVSPQINGPVKGFSIRQHQVAGVADLDVARARELEQLNRVHPGLQGDGVFGQHFEHIRRHQARDDLHIVRGDRGATVVQYPGLRHITRQCRQLDARTAAGGLERAAAQADVATILTGGQGQVASGRIQAGVTVGADAAVLRGAQASLHRDAAYVDRATDVHIAVRLQQCTAKAGAGLGANAPAQVQGRGRVQAGRGQCLAARLAGLEHGAVVQSQGAACVQVERVGAQGGGNRIADTGSIGLGLPLQGELTHRVHGDGLLGAHLAADGHRATAVDDNVAGRHGVGRAKGTAPGGRVVFHLRDQLHLGGVHRLLAPDGNVLDFFNLHQLGAGFVDGHVVVIVLGLGAEVIAQLNALVIHRIPIGGPLVLIIVEVFVTITPSLVAHDVIVPVVAIDIAVVANPAVTAGQTDHRTCKIVVPVDIDLGGLRTEGNGTDLVVVPAQATRLVPVGVVATTPVVDVFIQIRATPEVLEARRVANLFVVLGGGGVGDVDDRLGVLGQFTQISPWGINVSGGTQPGGGRGDLVKADGEVAVVFRIGNHPINFGEDAVKTDHAVAFVGIPDTTALTFPNGA